MPQTQVPAWECNRCGHIWVGRNWPSRDDGEKPMLCPKCRTPYWDTPRKRVPMNRAQRRKVGIKNSK